MSNSELKQCSKCGEWSPFCLTTINDKLICTDCVQKGPILSGWMSSSAIDRITKEYELKPTESEDA
jgi:hypothetical protein